MSETPNMTEENTRGELFTLDDTLTIPNMITAGRMALTGFVTSRLEKDPAKWGPAAIALSLSDNLDGFIARRFDQTSELGRIMDPVADVYLSSRIAIALDHAEVLPRSLTAAAMAQRATKSAIVGLATAQLKGAETEVTRLGKYSEFVTNTGFAGFMLAEKIKDPDKRKLARIASGSVMAIGIGMGTVSAWRYNEQRKELLENKRWQESESDIHKSLAALSPEKGDQAHPLISGVGSEVGVFAMHQGNPEIPSISITRWFEPVNYATVNGVEATSVEVNVHDDADTEPTRFLVSKQGQISRVLDVLVDPVSGDVIRIDTEILDDDKLDRFSNLIYSHEQEYSA